MVLPFMDEDLGLLACKEVTMVEKMEEGRGCERVEPLTEQSWK